MQANDELEEEAPAPPTRRAAGGGFALSLTVLGLALSAYLLFDNRELFSYWASAAAPIELGAAGGYQLERLAENLPAHIQGAPGPVSRRFERFAQRYELVAVRGTPVLVRRRLAKDALLLDPAPFSATGRLVSDTALPEYREVYAVLAGRGEAVPRNGHLWVLLDGELPRSGWQTPALLAALLALLVLNVVALARRFLVR